MDERLKQQLDFILEIDKEKNILRQTKYLLPDTEDSGNIPGIFRPLFFPVKRLCLHLTYSISQSIISVSLLCAPAFGDFSLF